MRYVLGVLAMIIPLSALFGVWGRWTEVLALWAVTVGGGFVVTAAYALDHWMATRTRMDAAEFESQVLRPREGNVEDPE